MGPVGPIFYFDKARLVQCIKSFLNSEFLELGRHLFREISRDRPMPALAGGVEAFPWLPGLPIRRPSSGQDVSSSGRSKATVRFASVPAGHMARHIRPTKHLEVVIV